MGLNRDAAGLTAKQAAFVREYIALRDAKAAAAAAGYSVKGGASAGYILLRKPAVKAAVAAGTQKATEAADVTAADVVRELARVGLSDAGELFDEDGKLLAVAKLPLDIRRAIASVEVAVDKDGERIHKVKLWPKVDALNTLAKKFGLLLERQQLELGPGLAEMVAQSMERKP